MPIEVRNSGAWDSPTNIEVRDGSGWKDAREIWVRDGGVWKQVFGGFAPTNFSAIEQFVGSVQLSWRAPVNPPSSSGSYEIQYRIDGGPWNVLSTSISYTATNYTHSGCGTYANGNDVEYQIRSLDGSSVSTWEQSNTVTITNC